MIKKPSIFRYLILFGGSCLLVAAGPALAKGLNLELENGPDSVLEGAATTHQGVHSLAGDIVGRQLVNEDGDRIGDISDVVRSKINQAIYAVVTISRPGKDDKNVTVPLSDIKVMPEEVLVQTSLNADDYAVMPAYKPDNYAEITRYTHG